MHTFWDVGSSSPLAAAAVLGINSNGEEGDMVPAVHARTAEVGETKRSKDASQAFGDVTAVTRGIKLPTVDLCSTHVMPAE